MNPRLIGNAARWPVAVLGLIAIVTGMGCDSELNTVYGQRTGIGQASVNGTAVLANMFEEYGHDVSSRTRLSPSIRNRADVIVWFPDDFAPPSQEATSWLEQWLGEQPGRTLIYVGRDFDAAPLYWQSVEPLAGEKQHDLVKAFRRAAEEKHALDRKALHVGANCSWFQVEATADPIRPLTFTGATDWRYAFNPARSDLRLASTVRPSEFFGVDLEGDLKPILSRAEWDNGSQLLLVANGSFLLNLPLVNREHRKLAAKLISRVGEDRRVVFLESGPGGPAIKEGDDSAGPSLLGLFTVPPFDAIFLHLAVVGLVFAVGSWPIFGRPRTDSVERLGDFGRHVTALGALLAQTRDIKFAEQALTACREKLKQRSSARRGRRTTSAS